MGKESDKKYVYLTKYERHKKQQEEINTKQKDISKSLAKEALLVRAAIIVLFMLMAYVIIKLR